MRHVFFAGWLMMIASECARILRPGGTLFMQVGSTRDDSGQLVPMDTMLYDPLRRTGLDFQSRVVWRIPHGLTPRRRLAERHETALVFSKGEPTFNATPARTPQKDPGKRAFRERSAGSLERGAVPKGALSGCPLGAWPDNVWDISTVRHNHPEKTDHPAQFPLALARRAVLLYTMPGELVVDPFSGSGTTHAACIETGRSFSGADLSYEDTRRARLERAMPDMVSMLPGMTDESVAVWQAEARRVDHGPAAVQAVLL
jgi:DNA modification methylase